MLARRILSAALLKVSSGLEVSRPFLGRVNIEELKPYAGL
jgi:hypothetical protein